MKIQQFISAIDDAFRDAKDNFDPNRLAAEIAPTQVRVCRRVEDGALCGLEVVEVFASGQDIIIVVEESKP